MAQKTEDHINHLPELESDVLLSTPFSRRKADLPFMRSQLNYRYYEDSLLKALTLPYACDQLSMLVLLPSDRYGLEDVEGRLNLGYLKQILGSSYSHEVIVSLPKFKIESEVYPKETLAALGSEEMFSDHADFSGISKSKPLKIGTVVHKTFIEVSEKKTEAAAVTRVDMVITGYGGGPGAPPPPPKIFKADHPFIFLIIDNRTGLLFFVGRYVGE